MITEFPTICCARRRAVFALFDELTRLSMPKVSKIPSAVARNPARKVANQFLFSAFMSNSDVRNAKLVFFVEN